MTAGFSANSLRAAAVLEAKPAFECSACVGFVRREPQRTVYWVIAGVQYATGESPPGTDAASLFDRLCAELGLAFPGLPAPAETEPDHG